MSDGVADRTPDPVYSPHLRTALVLTGTGTAGAYHAGVLRALHEAGIKIDLVAGCGMGVAGALFAAVDGGSRLWDAKGLWRDRAIRRLYRWRPSLVALNWSLAIAAALLLAPLALLLAGVVAYPFGVLLRLVGVAAGETLAARYGEVLDDAFAPGGLPDVLPGLVVAVLLAGVAAVAAATVSIALRSRRVRRERGPFWWRIPAAPLGADAAIARFTAGLWQLIKGAAAIAQPAAGDLSRRYTELVAENLGQPGFRELIVTAHDVDARCDLVFALLAEPHRRGFLQRAGQGRPRAEIVDLAGTGREHAIDALAGALSLPLATEARRIRFAPESYWRGERHRVCARPEAVGRLLEELHLAGVEQVIVVCATSQLAGPHALSPARGDLRGRLADYLATADAAAVDDAVAAAQGRFRGIFVVRPEHNPIAPLDFDGTYDDRSDRRQQLDELIDRGYEDAYRQFIDPVVGASGDRLEAAAPSA